MASDRHSRRKQPQQEQEQEQQQESFVDPDIWRAIAGRSVRIPAVHSGVYYFPQGYLEQASSTVSVSPLVASKPLIPCRVLRVLYLADKYSDEVYVKILLQPLHVPFVSEHAYSQNTGEGSTPVVSSFSKVLTPSDANNGGGFSVPKYCAESIFPKLDYNADPPVQTVHITDVHGKTWDFRHIYRGTPRRHLMTTGWTKFVNGKKMISGDSVVFMKKIQSKELYVGIRRAVKLIDTSYWVQHYADSLKNVPEVSVEGSFSRDGKGKVPPELVLEAAERAVKNIPFEVVYYPRAGSPDFVVASEKVNEAISIFWSAGMRVKMAVETDDSSKLTWFQGTVKSVVHADNGLWNGSFWRMLEVEWDESELLRHIKRVSPWQVEVISTGPPPIHAAFPQEKRLRVLPTTSLLNDGEGNIPLPTFEFNSVMGQLSPHCWNYNSFPAGMQGARQNPFYGSNLPNFMNSGAPQMCPDNHVENMPQKVDAVSTNLNTIRNSSSNTPSPDSQNSVQLFGASFSSQQLCNSSRKPHGKTVKVFGMVIGREQPADDTTLTEYDDCATDNTKEHILSKKDNTKLPDGLDAQCQISSVGEAFVNE